MSWALQCSICEIEKKRLTFSVSSFKEEFLYFPFLIEKPFGRIWLGQNDVSLSYT